jgi:hypothetical protein
VIFILIFAQGFPLYLVTLDIYDFPPLAQFVLLDILPASSQQRTIDKVIFADIGKKKHKRNAFAKTKLPPESQQMTFGR